MLPVSGAPGQCCGPFRRFTHSLAVATAQTGQGTKRIRREDDKVQGHEEEPRRD